MQVEQQDGGGGAGAESAGGWGGGCSGLWAVSPGRRHHDLLRGLCGAGVNHPTAPGRVHDRNSCRRSICLVVFVFAGKYVESEITAFLLLKCEPKQKCFFHILNDGVKLNLYNLTRKQDQASCKGNISQQVCPCLFFF